MDFIFVIEIKFNKKIEFHIQRVTAAAPYYKLRHLSFLFYWIFKLFVVNYCLSI